MEINIPIISDTLRSEELLSLFKLSQESTNANVELKLIPSEERYRSPFSDPNVVVALIGATATTLAAIIALIGVVWSNRKKKTGTDATIEIKLNGAALDLLQELSPEKVELLQKLLVTANDTLRIDTEKVNKKTLELLEEVPVKKVEHLAIMEDE